MNSFRELEVVANWQAIALSEHTANTTWREHVATLDVAREYWG